MMKITSKGFSLAEVVVATAIIALMMISLLNFVSYSGEVWQRNHMTISLNAEGNMLLDAIEREMNYAKAIVSPAVSANAATLSYVRLIKDNCTPAHSATATYRFVLSGENLTLAYVSSITDITGDGSDGVWTVGTVDGDRKLNTDRYSYTLARHVTSINFSRINANQINITVTLEVARAVDKDKGWVDPNYKTMTLKRSIMIPGI